MKIFSLLLILVYAVLSLSEVETIYEAFGLSLDGIADGKLWQLLSYGFLHASWWHLIVNVVLVLLLGLKVQHILGLKKAVVVTLLGVLIGGFIHLLLSMFLPVEQQGLLVGVSGGMMALLLCLTTLDPDHRVGVLRLRSRHLGMGFLLSSALLTLLTPSLGLYGLSAIGTMLGSTFGEEIFHVSHACHFGGGIAGLFYAQYLLRLIR